MASASLRSWTSARAAQLDQIEGAHRAVGGSARGRRWATEQVNHAYVVLLSSQFQGFCRDLDSECVDCFVRVFGPPNMGPVVRAQFLLARQLDRANPSPSSIGADFNRFGIDFWKEVRRIDARNDDRQFRLEQLGAWRNAIAHQDFDPSKVVPSRVQPLVEDLRAMPTKRRSKSDHRPQLGVGDRVAFQFAGRRVVGTVIEDRGRIGFKRARLLAVRVRRREADDLVVEMPADELHAA